MGESANAIDFFNTKVNALEDPRVPEVYEYNGHYYQVIDEAVTWQEA